MYVEVAIPIPLRHAFTYRVPDELHGKISLGSRVAVPFAGRKLAGFVVGESTSPPAGVTRIHSVAGRLDEAPLFTDELLNFLVRAADYYLHPLGEVLKAAAPALSSDAMKRLRETGFLADTEQLPGRRIGTRKHLFARRVGYPTRSERLGKQQRAALEQVPRDSEIDVDEINVPSPRRIVRALSQRGLVELVEREILADPFFRRAAPTDVVPVPNPAQVSAIDAIATAIRSRRNHAFLLHGITGSGKTEVYLRTIQVARDLGLGTLLLVPEIALTPQLVGRFRARFGDDIAVLHSGLGDRDRHDAWRQLRLGRLQMAVGARSALFAPVPNLGLIIVDEEHDPSFKQEEGFRYHGRDMALLRAQLASAVCVLGSATPAIESARLAASGRVELITLPERATEQTLPEVEIVDLARNRNGPSGHPLISAPLHRALERCLAAGDQAILFLNRRGYAPSLRCIQCGELVQCPSCSVALTEHRRAALLRCHYCDFATSARKCPKCKTATLERLGLGTEQLEDTLRETFAGARVARLDRDTASGARVEDLLDQFRRRELDILVGTQMVTKGHDLPGVTLVGVVLADQSLAFPDFRAGERTFQLLAQVAGRAGRGEKAGRVVMQTYQPHHHAIALAAHHDYREFFNREIEQREALNYPPFSRLVAVRVSAAEEDRAREVTIGLAEAARRHPAVRNSIVEILGPAPAPIARLRSRFRFRLLLRSRDRRELRAVALVILQHIEEGLGTARATVDVDPVSML